ncbi:MAG: bifunctional phosphoglucose/phosphomannose isomerase [Candidatus Kapaibacterium sp.]
MNGYTEYNKNDMREVLINFPKQIEHALKIADDINIKKALPETDSIAVLGMGGSAIGGDLTRAYIEAESGLKVPVYINRDYDIPAHFSKNTLFIASSYSGGTEETISGVNKALQLGARVICISSGGKLSDMAEERGLDLVKIPGGFQPRCALGYSFIAVLSIILKSGLASDEFVKDTKSAFDDIQKMISEKAQSYNSGSDRSAELIKDALLNKIPVIYSPASLEAVNLRWRGQFQENAKSLAFGSVLPEMNHNEINGWGMSREIMSNFLVIFLRDKDENTRVKTRFEAMKKIFADDNIQVLEIAGEGGKLLTRMFDLLYIADWASLLLAEAYGKDPIAIPVISKLKTIMSGS